MTALTDTPTWQTLASLAEDVKQQHMRDWFASDTSRASKYQQTACGIELDFSKNLITDDVLKALFALADESQVSQKRDAMFKGDIINHTEKRAVLHTALRNFSGEPVYVDGQDVMPEVLACQDKIKDFVASIHSGERKGYTGKALKQIVSIGIGGSFLGPKIMSEALKPYWFDGVKVHFVANVDGCHIQDVLANLDHEETLVVMSSKSFTTQETLQNTLTAKDWFLNAGGTQQDIAKHFIAVSSNIKAATDFGMAEDNIFPMWDWVGGRYSLWSAIGLPIALTLGYDNYRQLLQGAFEMDEHFKTAPAEQNLPMLTALLGVWYINFFGAQSHVLLPYYHYLRGFPAYVQQLDMESNGKNISGDTTAVDYATGPIIWGSEGTNGQHSFHQLIHQGTLLIPADFMLPLNVPNQDNTHHAMLASNCFGQTQALMQGKTFDECYADLEGKGLDEAERVKLATHKTMPGNKPSNTLLFEQMDPKTLGSLVAMYEHKVFVQGAIWGVNSFDQWGVELGKELGNQVLDKIVNTDAALGFDSSTNALIARFRQANS
ncbi:glucose-6-phosphate isomerase [Paraglaciecola sp. T6c]|uniref:Glucose-6-phosphate isomerase n=1 Tax=Pseudoalteromonas atlantica (strain T6c / ATCC BAA-1087) TaxID=3042615 RepID=G6PI_PSEA6|nr:glucose-6-phosphate isomerase [Paraglaciecola sp. T6c]Q15PR3.1 RecName: Full=Glucose-6-phosphate isomerase; Short=GPI; AltName: Full=Phosphoglucose isomerase; Short=PGI; AltName: Full=Phosphohexose isomerase; Short=PHI [Paraglaciecola sp. T6c]ABG42125.1 glucose-6-phosphate isomerase [Paraglaciecola sp. T6c]